MWKPALVGLLACLWVALGALPAEANRFGPPWQSRVVVDQATLFSQPNPGAAPVGPLARGQLVVVVGESTANDGTAWTQTPDGWIASNQIEEEFQPWIA